MRKQFLFSVFNEHDPNLKLYCLVSFIPVVYLIFFHLSFVMFVWSYWKTIFTKPSNPTKEVNCSTKPSRLSRPPPCAASQTLLRLPLQFCLPKADKERYEKEERPESQQEILWRAANTLPLYTRTGAGGLSDTCAPTGVSHAAVDGVGS